MYNKLFGSLLSKHISDPQTKAKTNSRSDLLSSGFNVIRIDRKGDSGGGLAFTLNTNVLYRLIGGDFPRMTKDCKRMELTEQIDNSAICT